MALSSNQKGLIVVGVALALVTGTFFVVKTYLYPNPKKSNPNFLSLQENLGLKPNSEGVIISKFNDGANKFQFYGNDRVFIFDKNDNILIKGKYEDGGKKIILDSGKSVSGNSVWKNLLNVLK
jgi:hypothetical protein